MEPDRHPRHSPRTGDTALGIFRSLYHRTAADPDSQQIDTPGIHTHHLNGKVIVYALCGAPCWPTPPAPNNTVIGRCNACWPLPTTAAHIPHRTGTTMALPADAARINAHTDDADLLTAIRTGNAHAITALYKRHHHAVHIYARSLTRCSATAADLAAHAWLRLLTQLRNGRGPTTNPRAYLTTTIRNAAIDHTRRNRIELVDDLQRLDQLSANAPQQPQPPNPEELTIAASEARTIETRTIATAFQRLSTHHRQVLILTAIDGHQPTEIAPHLRRTADATRALAYRARTALRAEYQTALRATTDNHAA